MRSMRSVACSSSASLIGLPAPSTSPRCDDRAALVAKLTTSNLDQVGSAFPERTIASPAAEHRSRQGMAPVALPAVRDAVLYITLVLNVVSMVAMISGILMHSGRGGGLSDMFGGGGGAALGSSAAERNLNRITFVFALIWVITVIALGFLLVR